MTSKRIDSAHALEAEFQRLTALFAQPESEATWKSFDDALQTLRQQLLADGAWRHDNFIPGMRRLRQPLAASVRQLAMLLTFRLYLSAPGSQERRAS